MNAPNRYELFVLDEGEKPCVVSTQCGLEGYLPLDPLVQGRIDRGHENSERGDRKNPQARSHARQHDPWVCKFKFAFCIALTRASLLRSQLLAMPQVLFAGYKVPHPLHPYFLVKIQTDGTITPTAALEQACTKLIGTLSSLEAKFKREFSFKDVEGVAAEDPYGASNAGPTWASGRDYMDL